MTAKSCLEGLEAGTSYGGGGCCCLVHTYNSSIPELGAFPGLTATSIGGDDEDD